MTTTEPQTIAMNPKQESLMHAAICLLMVLLALGGLAYGVAAGLVLAPDTLFTLDGILLVLVCLTILATFSGMLLSIVLREGWLKLPAKRAAAPEVEVPSSSNEKPAAESEKSS